MSPAGTGCCLCAVNLLQGCDVGIRVDVEQAFPQHLHLGLSDGLGGGHQLSVDVGYADGVAVHDGQMTDAAANQPFGTPAADSAHAEEDHPRVLERLKHGVA